MFTCIYLRRAFFLPIFPCYSTCICMLSRLKQLVESVSLSIEAVRFLHTENNPHVCLLVIQLFKIIKDDVIVQN